MIPTLKTERLVLRALVETDLQCFLKIAAERSVVDTTISVPFPLTESEGLDWIERAVLETDTGKAVHFAVALPADEQRLIGYVAIKSIDREHAEAELSFWFSGAHTGRGYATEAGRHALKFAFEGLKLNRICAYHMVRNDASRRVLIKLGFAQEGLLRQRVRKWGVFEDVLLWAVLRGDTHP